MNAPTTPRRAPSINLRLWFLVSLVLLLLPLGITLHRKAQGASESDAAAQPTLSSPGPEARTTRPTDPAQPTLGPSSTTANAKAKPPGAEPKKPKAVPSKGPDKYRTATRKAKPASSKGRLIRYRVRVEKNLDLDANEVARQVAATLNDRRSWRGDGSVRFQLVGTAKAELTINVTTPGTTDKRCHPLKTRGRVSCQQGAAVNLNAIRWARGVKYFGDDVPGYRRYLVNHEVGHFLGQNHRACPGKGKRAPVMQQQTKGLRGCKANPWVKPSRK